MTVSVATVLSGPLVTASELLADGRFAIGKTLFTMWWASPILCLYPVCFKCAQKAPYNFPKFSMNFTEYYLSGANLSIRHKYVVVFGTATDGLAKIRVATTPNLLSFFSSASNDRCGTLTSKHLALPKTLFILGFVLSQNYCHYTSTH